MSDHTEISWTDSTWNIVTGCTRISPGCLNCYIERTPPFRIGHRKFDGQQIGATTGVQLHPDRLETPLHWRRPRRIFVCSLADLFHDDVSDEHIAKAFVTMTLARQHTFQVLTKRPARLRSLMRSEEFLDLVTDLIAARPDRPAGFAWPRPNIWLGVSAENQQWADIRIPLLLDTPAAVRWVSAEPLLGPIGLKAHWLRPTFPGPSIDWVVTGGESGSGFRPADHDWFRSIRDQCRTAGTAYYHKQNGGFTPKANGRELDGRIHNAFPKGDQE